MKIIRIITTWLHSERFWYLVLAVFLLHALWFVFSARYPMAFDENFHIGLIRLHADQWLPFFTSQPDNAAQYGAAVRDPSYLYHYLMSLPWRMLGVFTDSDTTKTIILRLLNVIMFVWSLVIARRLLLRARASRALAHIVILIFALVPIVPFLAAHVNYDNLFILLTLYSILLATRLREQLVSGEDWVRSSLILALAMCAGSLVKYAYLPIAAGVVIYLTIYLSASRPRIKRPEITMPSVSMIAVCLLLVVGLGMFVERYAVNTIRYGAPNPDCAKVLDVDSCLSYGPWARDHIRAQALSPEFEPDPIYYAGAWIEGMWRRCFFAINHNYANIPPLPLPGATAAILAAIGLPLVLRYWLRTLSGNHVLQLGLIAFAVYITALTIQLYEAYLKTGAPMAINGRYLLPFLPFVFLIYGLSLRQLMIRSTWLKLVLTGFVVLMFSQGGGVVTFIIQSDSGWFWQYDPVIKINETIRPILDNIIYG